jgi:hypothetical protein
MKMVVNIYSEVLSRQVTETTTEGAVAEEGAAEDCAPEDDAVEEGAVEEGAVEEGAVEEGAVEEGAVEEGAVEEGAVEEGAVEEGAVEEGAAEKGAVEEAVNLDIPARLQAQHSASHGTTGSRVASWELLFPDTINRSMRKIRTRGIRRTKLRSRADSVLLTKRSNSKRRKIRKRRKQQR